MTDALRHRGPDGFGHFADPARRLHLGHRRLAVIDIRDGAQPMGNEDGQVQVVFNGEIYNHRELRRALEARGHIFRTNHSDTETLVHGWEEWGEELPLRLNGMFAFAIYDQRAGTLFLARDRFGEKPLYYTSLPHLFVFGSEVTALLAHPGVPRQVDGSALQKLFAHGFFPAPNTLYRDIRKLPAGHSALLDLRSGAFRTRCYWRFRLEPDAALGNRSEAALAEELWSLIEQAVARRLEADVPLGVFLSGGVDSSAMLAAASRHRDPSGIDCFTIGFREASYDESNFARQMAQHAGARHWLEICDLDAAKRELPDLLARIDEPLGDPSILPTHLVCRHARQKVTVALSGDGGDELFAGYDPFRALRIASILRPILPAAGRRLLEGMAGLLPRSDRNMSLDFKLRRGLRGIAHAPSFWNPVWLGPASPEDIADLFGQALPREELYSEALALWSDTDAETLVDRTLEFYTGLYLPDDILTKSDRASMLVSLETRAPFLDNDLVEFARRLPGTHKFRHGKTKRLLKIALRGIVPDGLIDRKKKGFGIPLSRWLRDIDPPAAAPVPDLNEGALRRRWAEHAAARIDHRQILWCWLALDRHFAGRG